MLHQTKSSSVCRYNTRTFLLSVPFDYAQLFLSVRILESLVGISKVPTAELLQGSVLGLQRVDEELFCSLRAGTMAGSVLRGADSLLDSTLPLQSLGNAADDQIPCVVTVGLVLPSQDGTSRPFYLVPLVGPGEGLCSVPSVFRRHIPQSSGFSPRNPLLCISRHQP